MLFKDIKDKLIHKNEDTELQKAIDLVKKHIRIEWYQSPIDAEILKVSLFIKKELLGTYDFNKAKWLIRK